MLSGKHSFDVLQIDTISIINNAYGKLNPEIKDLFLLVLLFFFFDLKKFMFIILILS
jgi:hypothetical protein